MRPTESTGLHTTFGLSHVLVTPGLATRLSISVTNTSDVIDGVTAIVDGIDPDWIRLERPVISLFPDASDDLEFVLDVPTSCPAGDYLIVVRVVSTIADERETVHDFWLTVPEIVDFDIELRPQIVTGGSAVSIEATIVNTGNATADFTVTAIEPTREVDCDLPVRMLSVPQDAEAHLGVQVHGSRPWFGNPLRREIIITARSGDMVVDSTATFNQKARIPRGVLTALTLAAIIALWAAIFAWILLEINTGDKPEKAVATAFETEAGTFSGELNVPLANVAGSASGRVTAATTGAGIARVTVEASRQRSVNKAPVFVAVGSVATVEDGSFVFEALVPGTYRFCYSGDGYQEFCYLEDSRGGTPDRKQATPLTIVPKGVLDTSLDIELDGDKGNFQGQVSLPPAPAGQGRSINITATPIREGAPEPAPAGELSTLVAVRDDGPEPFIAVVDRVTGEFHFDRDGDGTGDLPTPATYLIKITSDSFQTQQFEQRLDAGDAPVLNTVNLVAADARISGNVRDAESNELIGGVTVTARSGDFVTSVITPTVDGQRGAYVLTNLTTPATYVLTFERENYASTTITLPMQPGAPLQSVDVELAGGSGTVSGSVAVAAGDATTASADAISLGGMTITVTADDFVAVSSTQSTGFFEVTDLPLVDFYVITASADGFRTETRREVPNAVGRVEKIQLVMNRSTSKVQGTISFAGRPLAGATASLTDGIRTTTTTSASNPPGKYIFSDLPPGSYALTVDAPGLKRRVLLVRLDDGGNLVKDVAMQGAGISGTVFFAGKPLANATVEIVDGPRATTDAAGRYSFADLSAGPYRLMVTAPGLLETRNVTAKSGGIVEVSKIEMGSKIFANVLIDGAGASGVTVTLTAGSGAAAVVQQTTADGRVQFTALVKDVYTLTFERQNFTTVIEVVPVDGGSDATKDVTLQPELSGTVFLSGGRVGQTGVLVTLTQGTTINRSVITAASPAGRYVFPKLAAGTYTLTFEKEGLSTAVIEVPLSASEGAIKDIEMVPDDEAASG